MNNQYNLEDDSYIMISPIEDETSFRTDIYPFNIEEGEYLTLYASYENNLYDVGELYFDVNKYCYTYDNHLYSCDNIGECITLINNTYYEIINQLISISPDSEYEQEEDSNMEDDNMDFEDDLEI